MIVDNFEHLEYLIHARLIHADTRVLYSDVKAFSFVVESLGDFYFDVALECEFESVTHEIKQNLFHSPRISVKTLV